ncbi:hypothetical protein [Nocardia terpenica]|uniref:Uncharacterized protein n=1 Tax=Nocardia terpenica TaxID=455432 RepID=A0A164H9H3_9NOCA|nr:hypothetical protein [Nocardia terpenica]KZM68314.1 hypothetical protein AWN90_10495 [Nocardia terpenica]NQE88779.1 hypothetical protein [Nocardia terpenica]
MRDLPKPRSNGRLYIATGTPYRQALRDYFNEEGTAEVWKLDRSYRAGDLLLTVITTSPRMFITLEVAQADGADTNDIQVDWNRSVEFENGILADAVAYRAGMRIEYQDYYQGTPARRIWKALDEEYRLNRPWFTPDRWKELRDDPE